MALDSIESEISSPEEQIALACGCNRCLLDTLSYLHCLEPRLELIIDAQIYQEICVLVSDSVLIIALTLVTPLTEQEAEAKKREGRPSLFGQNLCTS